MRAAMRVIRAGPLIRPYPCRPERNLPPGTVRYQLGVEGTVDGKYWIPAEVDVSIRPGWFWHDHENARVRTPENLLELYFNSVGRGANLNLNVPPDGAGASMKKIKNPWRDFVRC